MKILADSMATQRQPAETVQWSSLKDFISSVHAYYIKELLYCETLSKTTNASDIFKMIKIVFAK